MKIAIVGAGIFGVTAALELAARSHQVVIVDREAPPHPRASSTDISKVIRSDYGSDALHTGLAREAIERWRDWNRSFSRPLYHEVGFLGLAGDELRPGSFEGDSYRAHLELGARVEAYSRSELSQRFPQLRWPHGSAYLNRDGGWAESGAVLAALAERLESAGVTTRWGAAAVELEPQSLRLEDGTRLEAETILVAAGAWTPSLLPELAPMMRASGHAVLHYATDSPALTTLPVWCADIRNTGYYGFPASDGRLKVGLHGTGLAADPERVTDAPDDTEARFARFVAPLCPELDGASVLYRRLCYYCDTTDGDFLIDRLPDRPDLVVAAGGSGHGFKFAPLLGRLIADRLEGRGGLPERWAYRVPRADREAARSDA